MQEDIDRAMEAGFDAHLTKPIDMEKLQTTIADIVNK
jgi:CheY-like chemotaxis protein